MEAIRSHDASSKLSNKDELVMNNVLTKFLSWGIATKLVVLFAIFGIVPMAAVGYLGSSATGEMEEGGDESAEEHDFGKDEQEDAEHRLVDPCALVRLRRAVMTVIFAVPQGYACAFHRLYASLLSAVDASTGSPPACVASAPPATSAATFCGPLPAS